MNMYQLIEMIKEALEKAKKEAVTHEELAAKRGSCVNVRLAGYHTGMRDTLQSILNAIE